MDYDDVKQKFVSCPAFRGLDEVSRALLFWKGREKRVARDGVVYAQGNALDNSFYMVLSGELSAEQNGKPVGTITESQIFGEMAFLNPIGTRTATIRAASEICLLLRFEVSQGELAGPAFRPLKDYFRSEAWSKIVSNAQSGG
ncbi:MAG: cyclic nucleotide-binding domain-containing protein [Verrucomicrobiota bacterium]